jgi:hypothetical protein
MEHWHCCSRKHLRRERQQSLCLPGSRRITYTYCYSIAYIHTYIDCYPHFDGYRDSNGNFDAHTHRYSNRNFHSNIYTNANRGGDANIDPNCNRDCDCASKSDANTDTVGLYCKHQ